MKVHEGPIYYHNKNLGNDEYNTVDGYIASEFRLAYGNLY